MVPTMTSGGYSRYVAIGDSQTEGLWDGDDMVGLSGFADRLAGLLDRHHPGLAYANLAVRGRRVSDVLEDQVPRALSMSPDLITVCVGMNDVPRPNRAFDRAMTDLVTLYQTLAGSGATVVTTTFPDVARLIPAARLLRPRILRVNTVIREASSRHGFRLVDLYNAPSMLDAGTWNADKMHGSPLGHELFAAAAAEALGLPGSSHAWAHAARPHAAPGVATGVAAQLQWTRNMLLPWFWRHVRGRSSGDGRTPKRPRLQPVTP